MARDDPSPSGDRHVVGRTRSRRTPPSALLTGFLTVAACSGRELVLGGDPLPLTGSAGDASGVGGSMGSSAGSSTAGAYATGTGGASGMPTGSGGTIVAGGSAGTPGSSGSSVGDAGEGPDPYPPVAYSNGLGYRESCPEVDSTWGFTCWHHENGESSTCGVDGSPACNVCSCAVPCGPTEQCPRGKSGESAECVTSSTTVSSCFITCGDGTCPLGMTCSLYPGTMSRVCMWEAQDVGQGQPR
jgi:hypothetical protein